MTSFVLLGSWGEAGPETETLRVETLVQQKGTRELIVRVRVMSQTPALLKDVRPAVRFLNQDLTFEKIHLEPRSEFVFESTPVKVLHPIEGVYPVLGQIFYSLNQTEYSFPFVAQFSTESISLPLSGVKLVSSSVSFYNQMQVGVEIVNDSLHLLRGKLHLHSSHSLDITPKSQPVQVLSGQKGHYQFNLKNLSMKFGTEVPATLWLESKRHDILTETIQIKRQRSMQVYLGLTLLAFILMGLVLWKRKLKTS